MSRPAGPLLWVIDPSLACAEEQGTQVVIDGWPGESRVFQPVLRPGDGPAPGLGYDVDAVVVMGSAASVYDHRTELNDLAAWLEPVVGGTVVRPLLGICYGHQLVAHLAGASVRFIDDDKRKRVGVESTTFESSRLLPERRQLRVVVSHREIVAGVPDGFRSAARRDDSPVDGLEHETLPVFSYQFHPEAREEFAARAGIDAAAIDDRLRDDSWQLLEAFRRMAAER